jgi:hypothetical protein
MALLLPVALTVLCIPLFTDNLWEASALLDEAPLAGLAALTVVPLLGLLTLRRRRELARSLHEVATRIVEDRNGAADRGAVRLSGLIDEAERPDTDRGIRQAITICFSASTRTGM